MGRRKKNSLPELRRHKGRARFRFNGREYYCGAFGSPEAYAERDRIIGEILCGRRPAANIDQRQHAATWVESVPSTDVDGDDEG